ncbi:hypothetical protein FQR65_LT01921 [Abscondita terminalis]|nr:hypothetical protein FQR65_LT01921 [Abscondita terminalis]
MKIFTVWFFLMSFKLNATDSIDFMELRQNIIEPPITECMCLTKVDPALVKNWFDSGVYASDPCFKCFLSCVAQKINVMDSAGKYDDEAIASKYGVPIELVKNCTAQVANQTDLCQKTYVHVKCVVGTLLKQYAHS